MPGKPQMKKGSAKAAAPQELPPAAVAAPLPSVPKGDFSRSDIKSGTEILGLELKYYPEGATVGVREEECATPCCAEVHPMGDCSPCARCGLLVVTACVRKYMELEAAQAPEAVRHEQTKALDMLLADATSSRHVCVFCLMLVQAHGHPMVLTPPPGGELTVGFDAVAPVMAQVAEFPQVLPLDSRKFEVHRVFTWLEYIGCPLLRRQIDHGVRNRYRCSAVQSADDSATELEHKTRRLWRVYMCLAEVTPVTEELMAGFHELLVQLEAIRIREADSGNWALSLAKGKAYETALESLEWRDYTAERVRAVHKSVRAAAEAAKKEAQQASDQKRKRERDYPRNRDNRDPKRFAAAQQSPRT